MTASPHTPLLKTIAAYYSDKLAEHGPTPHGVDWNGEQSQALRFAQLSKIIEAAMFSLNDVGCGYGALLTYLNQHHDAFEYRGNDVAEDMVVAARKLHENTAGARFHVGTEPLEIADYSVASGIFSVRLDADDLSWRSHIEKTLRLLDSKSRYGFAFNCLTSYSDTERMRDYLYYADPCYFFDFCKRNFSRDVALLHDYGLYEFTILVRRQR